MALVVITVQDDKDGDLKVKALFEPALQQDEDAEEPVVHNLAAAMLAVAMEAGGSLDGIE